MIIVIVSVFVVLVVGLIFANYIRHREEVFEGTVTDKDIREVQAGNTMNQGSTPGSINIGNNYGPNSSIKHEYIIKVQTTNGKSITWHISEGKYEIIKIGDHVTKAKGTTDIEIAPGATGTPPPTTPLPPSPPASVVN